MRKYQPLTIQIDSLAEAELELSKIGVDVRGIKIMKDKAVFFSIKIKNLTPPQANIIKQELLSCGADAATSRDTITSKTKHTDVIIFATVSQFKRLVEKLNKNHFDLPEIGQEIEKVIKNQEKPFPVIKFKNAALDINKRTFIMGIINVTPDSFSDGGKYLNSEAAITHAEELIKAGADIIDIGGESTRPGSREIGFKEELARVLPVVKALSKKTIISVDTRKSQVAEACLKAGAEIINDISALNYDKKMAKIISKHKACAILMHMQGTPQSMQVSPHYDDIIPELCAYLENSIEIALKAGILSHRIIIDPGFGFGKNLGHNLTILKKLKELKSLGFPILVGTSRKSMIGQILDVPPKERIFGSAATNVVAILNGANIIRLHDVFEIKQAAKMADAIIRRKG